MASTAIISHGWQRNIRDSHHMPARGGSNGLRRPTTSQDILLMRKPLTHSVSNTLKVHLTSVSPDTDSTDLYLAFSEYGTVTKAEIHRNNSSSAGCGVMHLIEPIAASLWQHPIYWSFKTTVVQSDISFRVSNIDSLKPMPVNLPEGSDVKFQSQMAFMADALDFGVEYGLQDYRFIHEARLQPVTRHSVCLRVDFLRRELHLTFPITVPESRTATVKAVLPFREILAFCTAQHAGSGKTSVVIQANEPPRFYQSRSVRDFSDIPKQTLLLEKSLWVRLTELHLSNATNSTGPMKLAHFADEIDLGRWTTYRLVFNEQNICGAAFNQLREALLVFNVQIESLSTPQLSLRTQLSAIPTGFSSNLNAKTDELSFAVRYQLAVCISQGTINEYVINSEFLDRLVALPERKALGYLEHAAAKKKTYFNLMSIFSERPPQSQVYRKIPTYCIHIRSVTVTPTKLLFSTPSVEGSNRILRMYKGSADRFLRVRFTDERPYGRLKGHNDNSEDRVLDRIYRCMTQGIDVGGRHFDFLAFGNSQFREHSTYFFAPSADLNAQIIRASMGDFSDNQIVAKYAARIGQCFSTTRSTRLSVPEVEEIDDVLINGFNFTDGVGKMSPDIARQIAAELGLPGAQKDPPSVFQFRFGGFKGVVAVDPEVKGDQVCLRQSQYKFHASEDAGLEIIKAASFVTAQLNRQLITCLKNVGIRDEVFFDMLRKQTADIEKTATNSKAAIQQLRKRVDPNQMTLELASLVAHGFQSSGDPFTISVMRLWRSWSFKNLKEKAAILVDDGAFLLGCTDERKVLKGWLRASRELKFQSDREKRVNALPEVFVQISQPADPSEYKVVTGLCVVARNPSLHVGDIRVVRAVDKPELHHLKNVVVFPQSGDRDVPSMCSGGDLDGDDFFVSWDERLIPPSHEWFEPAMPSFTEQGKPDRVIPTRICDQMIQFFIKYIKYNNLGLVANNWLALADWNNMNICNPQNEKLAQLHSVAVDFPKSGVPAQLSRDLFPFKWPHYMESRYRAKEKIYHSRTVLGQLYDAVQPLSFEPDYTSDFDNRILYAYNVSNKMLEDAKIVKVQYDADMLRIMNQYEIETEFEVWSTFVRHFSGPYNAYNFHEQIGQASAALKERFRDMCYEIVGSNRFEEMAPFAVAMYTVTRDEVQAACQTDDLVPIEKRPALLFISFPWIFSEILCKIVAQGCSRSGAENYDTVTAHTLKHVQNLSRDVRDDLKGLLFEVTPQCTVESESPSVPETVSPDTISWTEESLETSEDRLECDASCQPRGMAGMVNTAQDVNHLIQNELETVEDANNDLDESVLQAELNVAATAFDKLQMLLGSD